MTARGDSRKVINYSPEVKENSVLLSFNPTKCRSCSEDITSSTHNHCHCNDANGNHRPRSTADHMNRPFDSHPSSISTSMSSLLSFTSTDTPDDLSQRCGEQVATGCGRQHYETLNSSPDPVNDHGIGSPKESEGRALTTYDKMKSAELKIDQVMQILRLSVDAREKELLNELSASIAVRATSLEQEMKAYNSIKEACKRCLVALENASQSGQPFNTLKAKELCELEISKAKEIQESALFPDKEIRFVQPNGALLKKLQSIAKIGPVDHLEQAPSPPAPSVAPVIDHFQKLSFVDQKLKNAHKKSSPAKPKSNAWARPIKFKNDSKASGFCPTIKQPLTAQFDYKAAGLPKIIIGHNGTNDGELSRPWGVCCTASGNIIVADRSNHRIQIFSPVGDFIRTFGRYGKQGPGYFDRPAGVAVDHQEKIFVTDKDNHRIQVFTENGEFLFTFGREGKQSGQFFYPWDIDINSSGQVAVTDTRNQRIQLFSNSGGFLMKFGIENVFYQPNSLDSPRGIAFNSKGNLVVTDFNNHRILVIDSDFKKAKFLGGPGSGPKQFMRPQGVACDNKGKIAVADSRNNRIQIIGEDGSYEWQFGCGGTEPGQLDRPCGVCFSPDGKIVVVDFGNNRVQIF